MEELALTLFRERAKKPGFCRRQRRWPFLEKMVDDGVLPYTDLLVAEKLMGGSGDEGVAALLCHLSNAVRQGHLCIYVGDNQVLPPPAIWRRLSDSSAEGDDEVEALIRRGASMALPAAVCCDRGAFFFEKMHKREKAIAELFARLEKQKTTVIGGAEAATEAAVREGRLLSDQAAAINLCCSRSVACICGGPGTGKTYTAGMLIRTILGLLGEEERASYTIALAAPTGKAAANLHASIATATADIDGCSIEPAKTLHSLLGFGSRNKGKKTLDADLVLVDESSMLDIEMMNALLESIRNGCRLVLLGDPRQLPPVGVGAPFSDFTGREGVCAVLKTCMRQELAGIIEFAEAVNNGDAASAIALLDTNKNESGNGLGRPQFSKQEELIDIVAPLFPQNLDSLEEENLLEAFTTFKLLSPMRKGPFGVEALNRAITKRLSGNMRYRGVSLTPIMIASNDYRLQLFNGEGGLLLARDSTALRQGDYALFSDREGGVRKLPALMLPRFDYSYCLSVHKSQGSEFQRVLLLMPEGSELFGREMLYTGATRAKRLLEVWGSDATIAAAIASPSNRLSGASLNFY